MCGERRADRRIEQRSGDWLAQEPIHAGAANLRIFIADRARGDCDQRQFRLNLPGADRARETQAVHARQIEIEQRDIEMRILELDQRGETIRRVSGASVARKGRRGLVE